MRRLTPALAVSLIAVSLIGCSDDKSSSTTTAGDSGSTLPSGEPEGTMTYTDLAQTHVDTPVDYPQTPPVGGAHNPVWQT